MMETAVGHDYDIEQSAQKNDDEEADGTDISDSISGKRAKQQERNSISRKSSKKKLILKTSENVEAVLKASCPTLVKSRTRRKKAAQLPLRYSPSIEVKSTGKIKKRRRKPKSPCAVNHASISGELKGSTEKQSADTKREVRARRCLIKGISAADLSEDDSNSNFSTENRTILNAWKKISNEPVHLRNFKK